MTYDDIKIGLLKFCKKSGPKLLIAVIALSIISVLLYSVQKLPDRPLSETSITSHQERVDVVTMKIFETSRTNQETRSRISLPASLTDPFSIP